MSDRYLKEARQIGSLVFEWKKLPHQDIYFSELKSYISKIIVELKQLKGLQDGEKPKEEKRLEDFAIVRMYYSYPEPNTTILGGNTLEAEEEICGPQDKVFNHLINNYHQASEYFLRTWDMAKNEVLRNNYLKLKSPFITASTSQKLTEEFYKSKINPKKFAEKLNKDKSNIFKELKGDRKISIDQALQYSKEFGCDPVSLLFEDVTTELWGSVDFYNAVALDENYCSGRIIPQPTKVVKVPREIYSPDVKAVQIQTKGSYLNNYIAYYYYSKNINKSAHGKLAVVGQEWIEEDLGIQETYYYLGIYEEKIGGGVNILNPDPAAKNKYIAKDLRNVVFIAPVVSLVHPSTLQEDSKKREALKFTDKIFEQDKIYKDLYKRIDEFKLASDKMSTAHAAREKELILELTKAEKENDIAWYKELIDKKSA